MAPTPRSLCPVEVSLGVRLLAVRTGVCQPLSVCLDLHCAPAETVGVKQQVAGLGLNVLPAASTRGRCNHRNSFGIQTNHEVKGVAVFLFNTDISYEVTIIWIHFICSTYCCLKRELSGSETYTPN